MQTWESNYTSPDGKDVNLGLPFTPECRGACRGTHDEEVSMRRLRRYVNLFGKHPSVGVLAVQGLRRNYDGTLSIDDYTDDDNGHSLIGIIAVTTKSWEMCMGDSPLEGRFTDGGNRVPSAAEVMQQDVEAYNRWAEGEYVGYVVEKAVTWVNGDRTLITWEEEDALWGIDDDKYAWEEAVGALPEGAHVIDEDDVDEDAE
jgi:hypothetical protein